VRVVLVADDRTQRAYGPALRRLVVGLIDEAIEVTILSLGSSTLLDRLPSPPARLIVERHGQGADRTGKPAAAKFVDVGAAGWAVLEKVWPQLRIKRIAEELAGYKPTLLHGLGEHLASATRRLSKGLGVPYVLSVLAVEQPVGEFSISASRCRAVLACSSGTARSLRGQHTAMRSRIVLLPIGTHVADSPCCFGAAREWASVCCRSELNHGQGLPYLINSIKRLAGMGHNAHLTLSGSGPAEQILRRQVQRLNLLERVHFVPPFEELTTDSDAYKAAFQSADIFVLPRPMQSWRCELLEAMGVGNAVVAAETASNDLIVKDKTALAVPYQNEIALTEAMEKLLKDHDFARQLAANAQQYLRRHFLASRMVGRVVKVYRKALRDKFPVT